MPDTDTSQSEPGSQKSDTPPVAPALPVAPAPVATSGASVAAVAKAPAPAAADVIPDTLHAVLSAPIWPLLDGQIVHGPAAAITALIAAGGAVLATEPQVELARPFTYPLPIAPPLGEPAGKAG